MRVASDPMATIPGNLTFWHGMGQLKPHLSPHAEEPDRLITRRAGT